MGFRFGILLVRFTKRAALSPRPGAQGVRRTLSLGVASPT